MTKENLIESFSGLGYLLKNLEKGEMERLAARAGAENPWFNQESVKMAFEGIQKWLDAKVLTKWLEKYPSLPVSKPKNVGLVLAGNIPMVGFHDVLCVLMSGNIAKTKLSSKDSVCMNFLRNELININNKFEERWQKVEMLKDIDAIIATGTDNSARYFKEYFSKYPHIIRKNRTSVAALSGFESEEELLALGKDVFSYFGLGCRNVTYLLIHESMDPTVILKAFEAFSDVLQHNKYMNNYEYYRSIYLVNQQQHYASDFLILKEGEELFTPVANINFRKFKDTQEIEDFVTDNRDNIQCLVSNMNLKTETVRIGETQNPEIDDYADGLDTMKYLVQLRMEN